MIGRRAGAAGALLLVLCSLPAFAEEPVASAAASPGTSPSSSLQAAPGALPSGLGASSRENPVRRFEIIALGAFPIMLFYTDIGFDLHAYVAQGFDYRYAPWPFKNSSYSIEPNQDELLLRVGVAAGISIAFAGVDAIIRALRHRQPRQEAPAPIQPPEAPAPAAAGADAAASSP